MSEGVVWNPRWYVWLGLGCGALALIHARMGWLLSGHWLVLTLCLLVVLLYALAQSVATAASSYHVRGDRTDDLLR